MAVEERGTLSGEHSDGPAPRLTRLVHEVREVALGERTAYESGRLTVSVTEAQEVLADPALARVDVTWVSPGQSVRVVKLLDAVEPRTKGRGGAGVFPGLVGPARVQGRGETHVLRGAAVVVAGFLPRAQEAVLDMSGPAAELSPLAATHNLVVEFVPSADAGWEAVERALRKGLLALAVRLADAALEAGPDAVDELPGMAAPRSGLPRVAALTNLQTQGAFKDVFVYGRSFGASLPTLVDPNELEDGAVVSGQYGHPGLKNPTFVHQNHPVVAALRARHGVDLELAGVVLSPEPVEQAQKDLVSAHAARLCAAAGLDGLVVTKEGGGNADGDMALKMDALEELGIKAVGLFAEMAGPDGTAPSIVVPPSRATAMVSTGNYDERVVLPAVERALGGDRVDLLDQPAHEELELPTAVVYCSLSPLGAGRLTCRPQETTPAAGRGRAIASASGGRIRTVHYVNQFFAGKGGEAVAGAPPERHEGTIGPGRRLQQLLGDGFEIVATVSCGDDYAAGSPDAIGEVLSLVREADPDLVVAGPAFTSGRYGLACGRVAAAAVASGIPAVAAMHEDNPGLDEATPAPVVASGAAAREMGPSLERLATAVQAVAEGRALTAAEGRIGKVPRRNVVVDRNGAERSVDLLLSRLGGDLDATEVPLPRFDVVTPAAPVDDPSKAVFALVTEGAVVPDANPDRLESARATRWLRYPIEGRDALPAGEFRSVHGGFSTQWANEDPHRILPLDVARELERSGAIGRLHGEYFVTAGNGTTVANARKFGVELAAALRHAEVQAAILTST